MKSIPIEQHDLVFDLDKIKCSKSPLKKQFSVRIDPLILAKFKSMVPSGNRSKAIEIFMLNYIETHGRKSNE